MQICRMISSISTLAQAYVLNSATGSVIASLFNPQPDDLGSYGSTVAISAGTVVVGNPAQNRAFVFDARTGEHLHTLTNPTPDTFDSFAKSVAIFDERIVVGDPDDDTGASNAGSVYLFSTTTGVYQRAINNPAVAANDHFGDTVAIGGNIVAVGAPDDDTGGVDAGTAYTFNATTGAVIRTLNNPTAAGSDGFGTAVAISGTNVVVGAPQDDTAGSNVGMPM